LTQELPKSAVADLRLSARAYDHILKVACTTAALACMDKLTSDHVSEAVQYRSLDRQLSWKDEALAHRALRLAESRRYE
jgi:magnesium chelatase family protein